nr:uncharacterized protein LOC106629303 [Zonotrichia albicollis]
MGTKLSKVGCYRRLYQKTMLQEEGLSEVSKTEFKILLIWVKVNTQDLNFLNLQSAFTFHFWDQINWKIYNLVSLKKDESLRAIMPASKVNSDSENKASGSVSLNPSKPETVCVSENVTNVISNADLNSTEKNLPSLSLGKNETFPDSSSHCSVNVKICDSCKGEGTKCIENVNEKVNVFPKIGCAGGGRHAGGLLLCGPAPCMSLGARRVGASLALQGWVCVAGACRAPRAEQHLCGGARGFVTSPAQGGSLLAGCLAPLRVEIAGSLPVRVGLWQKGKLRHRTSSGMVGKAGFPFPFWEPVLPM